MVSRYKKTGWFNESQRHSLASRGIKTGRKKYDYRQELKLGEVRKQTKYISSEDFELSFSPIEDTSIVKQTPDGYEVRYLVQDEDPESPDSWGKDDRAFLVHYHRDFEVRNDNLIREDDAREWYQGKKIEQEKDYWIIPIEAYIHSGVNLSISNRGNYPDRQWDVSHVGLALFKKEEFKTKAQAEKQAKGLLETWNEYLSGDVYGVVVEKYDEDKNLIDTDSTWGYSGFKYAEEELKSYEPNFTLGIPRSQKKVTDYRKSSPNFKGVKSKGEAIQKGIEFQSWASNQNLSYGELIDYQNKLEKIAKRFGLIKEFRENGII